MSTTSTRDVALKFMGGMPDPTDPKQRLVTMFEIDMSVSNRGADISPFSQYAVLQPRTHWTSMGAICVPHTVALSVLTV